MVEDNIITKNLFIESEVEKYIFDLSKYEHGIYKNMECPLCGIVSIDKKKVLFNRYENVLLSCRL